MRLMELQACLHRARSAPAASAAEAFDRAEIELLKRTLRDHADKIRWHEGMIREIEHEIELLCDRNGWTESADCETDGEETE